MTDFLAWWADHWPLVPAIAGYACWEAYRFRRYKEILSAAVESYLKLKRVKP